LRRSKLTINPQAAALPDFQEAAHYLEHYTDPAFAWNCARKLAAIDAPLPAILKCEDSALWRAYWYCRNGGRDMLMRTVTQIYALNGIDTLKAKLNGFLLLPLSPKMTQREHYERAADYTNLAVPVVRCYEQLFFNVADRAFDEKFLGSIAYQTGGRMAELRPDYLETVDLNDLLMRCGYNGSIEELSYLSGGRPLDINANEGHTFARDLEAAIMRNGLMFARMGMLNQPGAVGLKDGRQLIQAAKAGGLEGGEDNPFVAASVSMLDELKHMYSHRRRSFTYDQSAAGTYG
jgi:hypothetical protein